MKDAEFSPSPSFMSSTFKSQGEKINRFSEFVSNSIENLHIEIEQIFSRGRDLKCAVLLNYSV